jgi:hypothetical protein
MRIRVQTFDDQQLYNVIIRLKKIMFVMKNCNIFIPRPQAFIPHLKRSPNTSKYYIYSHFWEINFAFLELDSADQNQCGSIQIRIHNTYVLKSPLAGKTPRSQPALCILCEESERNS